MILALVLAASLSGPPAADTPPQSPQDRMDALQQVYDSSCGSRGYGAYDDVCNSIRDQIRLADKQLNWELKHPSKLAAKPAVTLAPPALAPQTLAPQAAPATMQSPPTAAPPDGYSAAPTSPKT